MQDNNITIAKDMANQIDSSLFSLTQSLLTFVYKKFPILTTYFMGLTYGQILLAIFVFLIILFIRPLAVKLFITFLKKITTKTKTKYDDKIVVNIEKPLKFIFLVFGFYILVSLLYLNSKFINLSLASLAIYGFFWIVLAIVESFQGIVYKAFYKITQELSNELAKFVIRIIKILIWVLAISSILSIWGINVTALIASLGIGGLAFALAAKDTAANLFGSIAIMVDKSIKVGDWVKVNGVEGIVEDIGMRTTKIRTFYKSIIAVPNSIVANTHIENFSRRDVRRIKITLGLTYNTTNAQIANIVKEIKQMLLSHQGIDKNQTMLVNFNNFADSAKEIFVYTFTNTSDWEEYLKIQEDIFYKINDIVLKNGSDFAFPSQSIYVESLPENKA
jgi:MscS family membrane protein